MGSKLTDALASAETSVGRATAELSALVAQTESLRASLSRTLLASTRAAALTTTDPASLQAFMDKPYLVRALGDNQYELIVPTFIGFNAGWPIRHQGPYSVFLVSRFINLINPLPEWLSAELGYGAPAFTGTLEGNVFTVGQGDPAAVAEKLGGKKTVSRREGNTIWIRPASRFQVLRQIIREEGFLPFTPQPVPAEYLRTTPSASILHLRPHQLRDFERFLQVGAIAIFAYPQTGKSYVVLKALENLTGRKLIIVPRRALVDQWQARLELYLTPEPAGEVTITTYQALSNPKNPLYDVGWTLVVYDEAQHLPADFALDSASRLKTVARMGLSATPRREDGNEDLIPALCGFPVGADWPVSERQKPAVNVWLCAGEDEKLAQLSRILRTPADGKTFVFTFRLEIGRKAAEQLRVPFVYSKTRKPLEVIEQHDTVVISSVGNEGLSFPVRRVVEIDFLYGSTMESGQRLGRLAFEVAGKATAGEHHILMTPNEYHRHAKRLLIYEQWGLEIRLHASGESETLVRSPRPRAGNPLAGTHFQYTPALKRALTAHKAAAPAKPKPKDEIDALLAIPAIAAKIQSAETIAGRGARPNVRRAFRMCYTAALSAQDIIDGLALTGERNRNEPARYRAALKALAKVGLVRPTALDNERYGVDTNELNRLKTLATLVGR